MAQALFELEDAAAAAATPDLFGFWATRMPEAAAFSFALEGSEPVIWRSRLPEDLGLAARALAEAEIWQQQRDRALGEALPRMRNLLSAEAGLSFSASQELDVAEQNLLEAVSGAGAESVSLSLSEDVAAGWAAADRRLRDFMQRSLRQVLHAAWVETSIGEKLRGRTVVGWGGDSSTVWQETVQSAELQLHRRSVNLALSSRLALIRSFGLAGRGAVIVATAVSLPAGPVMALPAVWRFINDLARPGRGQCSDT